VADGDVTMAIKPTLNREKKTKKNNDRFIA
jgi:hypothetical protein